MAQQGIYTVAQAAKALNLSKATLRAYASKDLYKRYLSTEATPAPGLERKFTAGDLKLFAFIAAITKLGESHESVAQRLATGELDDFDWSLPEPQIASEQAEGATGQLVPLEQVRALQALLADARQRETESKEQAQAQLAEAQETIRRLERELGQAQGALEVYKRRRPKWLTALFGE